MLLASLYLPWRAASCSDESFGRQGGTVCGLLHTFSGGLQANDGLSAEVGPAAALFALLLVALAATAFARPSLAVRLPLGRCALLAGYFGIAVGIETRSDVNQPEIYGTSHYTYGAYVGLAATIVVLVAAGVARRGEVARYRSTSGLLVLALAGGLLGAFLLPWWEQGGPFLQFTFIGLASPAAVIAAALTLCLPAIWAGADHTPLERLGLGAVIALFTGAAASSSQVLIAREYGVWPALGLAGALVAVVLVDARNGLRIGEASWRQLTTGAAGALLLAALFLPWQRWCYGPGFGFGLSRRCFTTNAWTTLTLATAAAAGLAVALVYAVLQPRRVFLSVVELAIAFGLLVATVGFELEDLGGGGVRVERAYGSTIGFILAAVLIALALVGLRLPAFDWRRVPVRVVPIAACAAYLVILVLPWWIVNPDDGRWNLSFPALTWLTIAGAILGIHLLGLWARQITGASASAEMVFTPARAPCTRHG